MRASLPPLAWVLELERGSETAVVAHGCAVEVKEESFVEGAWSGSFQEHRFRSAITFSGSGGVVEDGCLILSSATHTLQPLYLINTGRVLICSNSLLLALAGGNSVLDPHYRYHDVDIMSIVLGPAQAVKCLPTSTRGQIALYYVCDLRVENDLSVRQLPKVQVPPFSSFDEYYALLNGEIGALSQNANDARRSVPYVPLSTLSSGYDSPACAVLAKAAGCRTAITFRNAADPYQNDNDSGLLIGTALGMETIEFDPTEYKRSAKIPEAEFLAPGYGGDDVVYCGAEQQLRGRLLFTGYHGDRVWSRFGKDRNYEFRRGDPSGGSLQEFRLRTCFINIPVPFIGASLIENIRRISNMPDMKPWMIAGTHYDRPIPRRIVEQAGVPRELFGQVKKAVARPARAADILDPPLESYLSPASLSDFMQWSATFRLFATHTDRVAYFALHGIHELIRVTVLGLNRLSPNSGGFGSLDWYRQRRSVVPWRYAKPRNLQSLLIFWAHGRMRHRYEHQFSISTSQR